MGWTLSFVVFTLIWWTVLFAVLPLGVRPRQASVEEGGWNGAPAQPQLLKKVILTTVITAVLFGGFYLLEQSNLVSFRSDWLALPE